ncbi:hypothetical protein NFX46_36970 [Streptomyces phaeoluteigriseus]|uniref:Uncharacterized protein n=1 Tax=Streptomyces phaeoluteigriseus TaxID=114686 RepID=A0ABY4ZIB2_9ACTN|nr:hypothetical protein [Streptomyces phaeoluteigriseus]USQ88853.1 hypothetical protein NFX46_36970 [Streptomyces phaeoluteigriseus]
MPEHLSIPHPTGPAAVALALAGAAWLIAATALLRRARPGAGVWGSWTGAQRTRRTALGAMRPGHDAIPPGPRGRRRTTGVRRRDAHVQRPETDVRRPGPGRPPSLPALPPQHRTGPHQEAVELTAAERAAFEHLVRGLSGDR